MITLFHDYAGLCRIEWKAGFVMRINAVFQGGGVKGIAFVGAIAVTEQKGFIFHRVAGTSSGSIVASFLAAGYKHDEMKKIIMETPFSQFLEKTLVHRIPVAGPAIRLLLKKGIYSGDLLEAWIRQKLLDKGVRTFRDVPKHSLYIIASDISSGKMVVLPDDLEEYDIDPDRFEIARAVRMSISIPYFFEPVILKKKVFVDGGILSNFPMWIFDQEMMEKGGEKLVPTIGYQLVGKNPVPQNEIRGPFSMFQALFSTMMGAHDERYIEKQYRYRTIKIDSSAVGTVEFDITREQCLELYESGRKAAEEFFSKWSYAEYLMKFQDHARQIQNRAGQPQDHRRSPHDERSTRDQPRLRLAK